LINVKPKAVVSSSLSLYYSLSFPFSAFRWAFSLSESGYMTMTRDKQKRVISDVIVVVVD
jgi:hypothetical protein